MPMGHLGEEFFRKYGADPRRMYRVPYTPDYGAYATVELDGLQQFRQKYGLSHQRRYLLFSGRLVQVKRVDLLIDAFARIAERRPDWDLLIAGEGVLRSQLDRRVPDRLQERVVWTGFLEQQELAAAYHAAEVLVLPSDREPWGVVVQEAMAAGLAVVASAADEIVRDNLSGRIFPAGNLNALENALLDATETNRLKTYREQSRSALCEWREHVDPVNEIRRALADVGVLTNSGRRQAEARVPAAHRTS
jgi:glycosyltransferase involved in cell wall biosynthesis